jgi:hypothetical protein
MEDYHNSRARGKTMDVVQSYTGRDYGKLARQQERAEATVGRKPVAATAKRPGWQRYGWRLIAIWASF